jgi:antirestriction protein ArdC
MSMKQKKQYAKMKRETANDEWFQKLESAIQGDKIPWRKPWKGGKSSMPSSLASKKSYRGGNLVMLWVEAMANGWTDLRFATRNQLIQKKMSIKGLKNDTGTKIKYFEHTKYTKKNDKGEEEEHYGRVLRYYEVFCVEQCEDYVAPVVENTEEIVPTSEIMEYMDEYVTSQVNLDYSRGGDRAYYSPEHDKIVLPPHDSFADSMGEVMTAIHEAVHSTGYATRLNRNLKSPFGSAEYAYEELIAELGSLIVTLTLGGEFKPDLVAEENANNVAYLQSWLKACKDKDKALNKAFGDAQKAADYILSAIQGGEEE